MAERIDTLPERRGRDAIYPWDQWMDGRIWRITRGTDFTVTAESMRQQVRITARRRGGNATTRIDGDEISFQVIYDTTDEVAA